MALPRADASNLTTREGGGVERRCWVMPAKGEMKMTTPLAPPAPLGLRERLNPNPSQWGVQALAEIGVAVALAAVLGQLRLFMMPQGGSVSLEMVPIIFVAVRRGVVPALTAGVLYGFLQFYLPGFFYFHPAQVMLDYPLAFGALCVAGFVDVRGWRSLAMAVTLAVSARFVFHFLSGLIFFAAYAPAWEKPWIYAAGYNLLYLVPEGILSVVLLWPLLKAYDAAFPARSRAPR
jgi:thiamine transporter